MRLKIIQEGVKPAMLMDQAVYVGLFLTGRVLKWFKPYFTKIQEYRETTTN